MTGNNVPIGATAVADLFAPELAFKLVPPSVQAPSTLPVGGADRQNLRSVPAAVPDVRWSDGPNRIYHRWHADQEDP
jgi:hypothetical protein